MHKRIAQIVRLLNHPLGLFVLMLVSLLLALLIGSLIPVQSGGSLQRNAWLICSAVGLFLPMIMYIVVDLYYERVGKRVWDAALSEPHVGSSWLDHGFGYWVYQIGGQPVVASRFYHPAMRP